MTWRSSNLQITVVRGKYQASQKTEGAGSIAKNAKEAKGAKECLSMLCFLCVPCLPAGRFAILPAPSLVAFHLFGKNSKVPFIFYRLNKVLPDNNDLKI